MITTKFLGFELKSPIIVGSSTLTSDFDSIKSFANAGAGAIILKSLFEEQISNEINSIHSENDYPEGYDYLSAYIQQGDFDKYRSLISECKDKLDIPIIASVNCRVEGQWIDYCKKLEQSGADAIELNVFIMPNSKNQSSQAIEEMYLKIVQSVVKNLSIPILVKLSPRFTNHLYIINELYKRGVKGVTMFNRYWEPDFNINKLEVLGAPVLSQNNSIHSNLRLIAQCATEDIPIDISASTMVHKSSDMIKYILAGATTVQLCSVLYRETPQIITQMNEELLKWMQSHEFNSISEFRGHLALTKDISINNHFQFMKQFGNYK